MRVVESKTIERKDGREFQVTVGFGLYEVGRLTMQPVSAALQQEQEAQAQVIQQNAWQKIVHALTALMEG